MGQREVLTVHAFSVLSCTKHEMQAVAKMYHSIPVVELILFSLVSDGFVLFFFFFPLLVLYVFALFPRNVYGFYGYGPTR